MQDLGRNCCEEENGDLLSTTRLEQVRLRDRHGLERGQTWVGTKGRKHKDTKRGQKTRPQMKQNKGREGEDRKDATLSSKTDGDGCDLAELGSERSRVGNRGGVVIGLPHLG